MSFSSDISPKVLVRYGSRIVGKGAPCRAPNMEQIRAALQSGASLKPTTS